MGEILGNLMIFIFIWYSIYFFIFGDIFYISSIKFYFRIEGVVFNSSLRILISWHNQIVWAYSGDSSWSHCKYCSSNDLGGGGGAIYWSERYFCFSGFQDLASKKWILWTGCPSADCPQDSWPDFLFVLFLLWDIFLQYHQKHQHSRVWWLLKIQHRKFCVRLLFIQGAKQFWS